VKNKMGGACSTYGDRYIRRFRWESLKKREHVQDLIVDGRTHLICIFRKWDGKAWTGLIWLRIGASGRKF
jgi:hypothetical protein